MAKQCATCYAPLNDYDRSCPRCGSGRATESSIGGSMPNCINCKASVQPYQDSCHTCGQRL